MEKFLDFLFGEKDEILIKQNLIGGSLFSYSKSELLDYYYNGLNFNNLEKDKQKIYINECNDKFEKNIGFKKNNKKKGIIYIIKVGEYYKIGRTIDINSRFKKYVTENPQSVELIYYYSSNDYIKEEEYLHNKFKEKNYNREWFKLDELDILFIKNLKYEI